MLAPSEKNPEHAKRARFMRQGWGLAVDQGSPLPFAHVVMTDTYRYPGLGSVLKYLRAPVLVIVRDYFASERAIISKRFCQYARVSGHLISIAGDRIMANHVHADGWHLPARILRPSSMAFVQEMRACGRYVSAAIHDRRSLGIAERLGVDFGLLSPVFTTQSHPGAQALGKRQFESLARISRIPLFALGGLGPSQPSALFASGLAGYAGISTYAGHTFSPH